jgi:hypothetical protein
LNRLELGLGLTGAKSVDGPADGHSKNQREKALVISMEGEGPKVILIWAIGFSGPDNVNKMGSSYIQLRGRGHKELEPNVKEGVEALLNIRLTKLLRSPTPYDP